MSIRKEEALNYHSSGRKGKIEVIATKPCFTSRDLSLAYTPGVAEPCREIEKNDDDVYKYTAKGNLVAVISNGTAVLGLGNIGAHAGKPVMEGKGVLFKRFADIDVFDLELKTENVDEFIKAVELMEPTFGGINLEDIKAPQCFEIEERLKESMNIPVFHDDQHGTAIISCAALINAAEIANKKLEDLKIVVSGAGAAAIACSKLYCTAGVKKENIYMFDSKGLIHKERTDLNKYKMEFANENKYASMKDAFVGTDVFIGVSKGNIVSQDMIKSMADTPIVFAMANPDPEITYPDAVAARKDIIMATGRSDFPNQVNNVLGFPFIFRGALDVRASAITDKMKLAAVYALAELAKEKVPEIVLNAYGGKGFSYGSEYIIPKPFDPRVLWKVAPAVAKAAVEEGIAKAPISDWKDYENQLKERLGFSKEIIRVAINKAVNSNKKIVFSEGVEEKIIRAANVIQKEKIARPILVGDEDVIRNKIKNLGYNEKNFEIKDPLKSPDAGEFALEFTKLRQRKGMTLHAALRLMRNPIYFSSMMVRTKYADGLIGGINSSYPDILKPALQCIGTKENRIVAGLYIVIVKSKVYFFADTTVNINPTAEELAEIAILSANTVKEFDIEPRIAMLSFSNFGSVRSAEAKKVAEATEIVKNIDPSLICDGEMQADTALLSDVLEHRYPFSKLQSEANVLIFPNLSAGNIAYKLFQQITDATLIGSILMGMRQPVHVIQQGATVDEIINMTAITVLDTFNK